MFNQTSESKPLLSDGASISVATQDQVNINGNSSPSLMTFWSLFIRINKLGWATSLSYTLSMQMIILTVLYRNLCTDEDCDAAASLISTYISVFTVTSMSILFATSIHGGYLFGLLEKDETPNNTISKEDVQDQITETYRSTLILSQTISMPTAALFLFFSQPILENVFQQRPKVSQNVGNITRLYAPAMPFLMARISAEMLMLAKGKNTPPMLLGGTTFLLSSSIGCVLSLGAFGLPKYGPSAFIIAADIEAVSIAILLTLYLKSNKDFRYFHFLDLTRPLKHFKHVFYDISKLAATFPLPFLIDFGMNWGAMLLAARISVIAQAKVGIMMEYAIPVQLISTAFGQCVAQELSRRIGASDLSNGYRVGVFGLLSTLLCVSPIPIACLTVPLLKESSSEIRLLAAIMALGFLSDICRYNLLQQLRPLNDATHASLLSCFFLLLGMGLSAILTTQTRLDVVGDAIGYSAGMFCAASSLFVRWLPRIRSLDNPLSSNRNQFWASNTRNSQLRHDFVTIEPSPAVAS